MKIVTKISFSQLFKPSTLAVGLAAVASAAAVLPLEALAQATRGGSGYGSVDQMKDVSILWPEIPWVRGADFAEFDRTIAQSRDEVRKMFSTELMQMVLPLVGAGADAEKILEPLAGILLTFDELHEKHKDSASKNLGVSLDAIFTAQLDSLYRYYDIKQNERKAVFANTGNFAQLQGIIASGGTLTAQQRQFLATGIKYVTFGTWTIADRGIVVLTFTLENLVTGERINFDSRGSIESAVRDLAKKVFDFFQTNEYQGWKDPQATSKWVPPSRTMPTADAATARTYCRNQGARLPYARELILAMQGGQYKPGGIPAFNDSEAWIVADKRDYDEQHYYFVGQEASTGGAIRTGAGMGHVIGHYWCILGDTAPEAGVYEKLFAAKRSFVSSNDDEGMRAINTVLAKIGDTWTDSVFTSPVLNSYDEAMKALKSRGVNIRIPQSMLGN